MKTIISFTLTLIALLAPLQAGDTALLRISSTMQDYNPSQPWEKKNPRQRHGIATILEGNHILTTAEMVANATFIELETISGDLTFPAEVVAVDYHANLALISPSNDRGTQHLQDIPGLQLADPIKLGAPITVLQAENNGRVIRTEGSLQAVDILSSFIDTSYFLTYVCKASMQSSSNSFTLPVLHRDKFLGILTSYSSKEQLLDVIAPEVITAFLADAADGDYRGFPSLGLATTNTLDPSFRQWLELENKQGGIYVTRTKVGGPADQSDIKKGDVIIKVSGQTIDRRGFYQHPDYGPIHWSHLVNGHASDEDTISVELLRNGKTHQKSVTLARNEDSFVPRHSYGTPPRYLVKGGLIFQELSRTLFEAYGSKWAQRAPLNLLDVLSHPEDYEKDRNRLVFISATIPTPATLGYESIRSAIIEKVNGKAIKDIPSLIEAFNHPTNGTHTIQIDEKPYTLYLDAALTDQIDQELLRRGIPQLSRP